VDQRGIRTIAKVGLVGKTISIDENTRYNPDYVRVKIACREIAEVLESAEGNLGMFIFDFFYEREET
jgi:preprotein translocase subunit YajC